MKKTAIIITIALIAILAVVCIAAGEVVPDKNTDDMPLEISSINGIVTEVSPEGYLIFSEENGLVFVNTGSETEYFTSGDISCGDFVYVDHSGAMTRSIPPQVYADRISMFRLEGEMTGHDHEAGTITMETPEHGEVVVNIPAGYTHGHGDVTHMTVYSDGAMTMSLPPQISAGHIITGYALHGAVTEINDGYIVLGEGAQAVHVLTGDGSVMGGISEGTAVRVIYNGQMTRSLPPQVTAISIEPLVSENQ